MSEDEQWKKMRTFIDANGDIYERGVYSTCLRRQVFADLAFRLRDEAVEQNLTMWQRAMDIVFLKANEEHWKEKHQFTRWAAVIFWFSHKAKPIHWIIAALIARN